MKLYLSVIFLLLYQLASCQPGKESAFVISTKAMNEVASLRKQGVLLILRLENGCNGCEMQVSKACNCKPEGLFNISILYQKGKNNFVKTISCCEITAERSISPDYFRTIDSLEKELRVEEKKSSQKFFPPVATDQPFYRIKFRMARNSIDFVLYSNQLKEGTAENKSWSKIPFFAKRKQILDYTLSIINNNR